MIDPDCHILAALGRWDSEDGAGMARGAAEKIEVIGATPPIGGGMDVDVAAAIWVSASIMTEGIGWGPRTATLPAAPIARS